MATIGRAGYFVSGRRESGSHCDTATACRHLTTWAMDLPSSLIEGHCTTARAATRPRQIGLPISTPRSLRLLSSSLPTYHPSARHTCLMHKRVRVFLSPAPAFAPSLLPRPPHTHIPFAPPTLFLPPFSRSLDLVYRFLEKGSGEMKFDMNRIEEEEEELKEWMCVQFRHV